MLRSDGEPALKALKEAIQAESSMKIEVTSRTGSRREQVIKEESCAYDSRSNGFIESKIRRVQGQIRTLKDALEHRLSMKVRSEHECLPWLIRHAGFLRSRLIVGKSGMTP